MINKLAPNEIKLIKKSGVILKSVLSEIINNTKIGVSTFYLNQVAEDKIKSEQAKSSFLNYEVAGCGRYPFSICVSLNKEIVHGLPDKNTILKEGDLVSIDVGIRYKGYCTDAAVTLIMGKVDQRSRLLVQATKTCLDEAIKQARVGNRIGAIGHTIEQIAQKMGFSVIRDLVGHGVGINPHMDPQIPNYGHITDGDIITENMALAIEPMLTFGNGDIKYSNNGWAIETSDGTISSHFEDTIITTKDGPVVITR